MQQLKIGEHFKLTAAMKNLFKKAMLFAAAAMAFVSCQNDTFGDETINVPGFEVSVNATTSEVARSEFGDYNSTDKTFPTLWEGTEKWAVCLNNKKIDVEDIEFSDDKTSAHASVTFEEPAAYNGTYTLFAVSPLSAYVSVSMESDYIRYRIPASQTPSATSCYPAAQILIAHSEPSATFSDFNVTFKHAVAYGKFSFLNVAEGGNVTGVTIKNKAEDVALAGRYVYAPSTKTISFKDEAAYEINLTTNTTTDLWFACGPAEVKGKTLTFIINTDNGKLEKEVAMPGNFVAGKVATFKIDMAGIDYPVVEEVIQYKKVTSLAEITAGEYVIVEKTKVLPNTGVSKNPAQIDLSTKATAGTDVLTNVDDGVKWIFTGTASAMKVQSYANNENYLHNNSSNTGVTINITNNKTWTIEAYNTGFSMKCNSRYLGIYEDGSDWRSYQTVNATNYGSDGACLTLYKKVEGGSTGGETPETPETPATPKWGTVTAPAEVAAAGGSTSISYSITDATEGKFASAETTAGWITNFTYTADKVTFNVDANTGAAREATVTLSYEGITETKNVTVKQAAAEVVEPEQPGTGGTFIETFANYKASLSAQDTSYNKSGSFAGVSESGITWSYTGCGNPGQTTTDITSLKSKGLTYDTGVTMGKGGTLSATIPGGATSVSFYILTSSKATCTVTIKNASGSTLKTQTVAKSTTGKVEITGINSNGGAITISFKEASTQNRVTVAGLEYTR